MRCEQEMGKGRNGALHMAGGEGVEFASSWVRVDHHFLFSAEPRQPNVAEETATTTRRQEGGGTYDTRTRPTASVAHSPVSLCVCAPCVPVCVRQCVLLLFSLSAI